MKSVDPTQPQPGDWEAALAAIEAAEARHDARKHWRRIGWSSVVVAALVTWGWWSFRGEEAVQATTAEAPSVAQQTPAREQETQGPTDVQQDMAASFAFDEPESSDSVTPVQVVEADDADAQPATTAWANTTPPPHKSTVALPAEAGTSDPFAPATAIPEAVHELESLNRLNVRALPAWSLAVQELEEKSPGELTKMDRSKWGALLLREGSTWGGAVTRELASGWWGRAGASWDARNRTWLAVPEVDAFGALSAAEAVVSDAAVWGSLGVEYRRHLKGRWSGMVRLDYQYLIARHMQAGQWEGEVIAPREVLAWGRLKEETPWRIGWGAGVDWSVNEYHALRFTLGGHVAKDSKYDYIHLSEGAPLGMGEMRISWVWK